MNKEQLSGALFTTGIGRPQSPALPARGDSTSTVATRTPSPRLTRTMSVASGGINYLMI